MKKQQKYRICANNKNWFFVEETRTYSNGLHSFVPVFQGGPGQAGLEACEEWLAKQPEEE